MRIAYFSPMESAHGGVKVVLRQMDELRKHGHTVDLVEWPETKATGEYDLAIATWCMTAPYVQKCNAKKKGYLVQHDETISYGNEVAGTYSMPWDFMIVVSPWLKTLMEGYGNKNIHVYKPAFEPKVFVPYQNKVPDRVLYFARHYMRKNHKTAYKALEIIKERRPQTEIVTFDSEPLRINYPFISKHYGEVLSLGDMAKLYSSAAVYMQATPIEGFGILSLESMACGTAVVTPDEKGTEGFGEGVIQYCDPYDPSDIADKVIYLLDHPKEREVIERNGRIAIQDFSWVKEGAKLNEFLKTL